MNNAKKLWGKKVTNGIRDLEEARESETNKPHANPLSKERDFPSPGECYIWAQNIWIANETETLIQLTWSQVCVEV